MRAVAPESTIGTSQVSDDYRNSGLAKERDLFCSLVIETTSLSSAAAVTQALLHAYREAGEQTGYCGRRFYQQLNHVGGLTAVTDMLTPRTAAQRTGWDALLAAGRPDLSDEAIAPRALALVA